MRANKTHFDDQMKMQKPRERSSLGRGSGGSNGGSHRNGGRSGATAITVPPAPRQRDAEDGLDSECQSRRH